MENNKHKSGLSSGFREGTSSRLRKILSNNKLEFTCQLEDKYMKLALSEYLNDLNFKKTESDGRFVLVSVKLGVYKFYDESPSKDRIYDIPSEWDIFKIKIEESLSKNPIVKNSKSKDIDTEEMKDGESIIYLLNKDNYRFYKGYISYSGEVFEVNTYDNKVVIRDLDGNDIDDMKLSKKVYKGEINIYSNKSASEIADEKLTVYDSKKDGLLKTKMEIEIEERKDELKEKGHIVLSNGKIVTTKNKGDGKDSKK